MNTYIVAMRDFKDVEVEADYYEAIHGSVLTFRKKTDIIERPTRETKTIGPFWNRHEITVELGTYKEQQTIPVFVVGWADILWFGLKSNCVEIPGTGWEDDKS